MLVFIGNLPGETPLIDIQQLLDGRNLSVDFSSHRSPEWKQRDYHFVLVKMSDPKSLNKLINEINGLLFHGHVLEARPFVKRRSQHDWDGVERRNLQLALNF